MKHSTRISEEKKGEEEWRYILFSCSPLANLSIVVMKVWKSVRWTAGTFSKWKRAEKSLDGAYNIFSFYYFFFTLHNRSNAPLFFKQRRLSTVLAVALCAPQVPYQIINHHGSERHSATPVYRLAAASSSDTPWDIELRIPACAPV